MGNAFKREGEGELSPEIMKPFPKKYLSLGLPSSTESKSSTSSGRSEPFSRSPLGDVIPLHHLSARSTPSLT